MPFPMPADHQPRTVRAALTAIVEAIESGLAERGACKYASPQGKTCVIGALFTPEQREFLRTEPSNSEDEPYLNTTTVRAVALQVGVEKIASMTGLSIEQCRALQYVWDENGAAADSLAGDLRTILSEGRGKICDAEFIL